ncbi:ChaN family lipoprotein [Bdellovibrio reynosensis]|uniref:ChaN family lipoprotein n=1 Tax=Bdellovibrio reynosensis TaxID=2835041 RepID=A0ABY4CB79_9BACT|nr:ChaN family lipoprotein [Bdellovibrio reynosensis]UOF01694.1 ChaN family lipoprotein [Bdellovibrio reynosensis]
MNSLSLFSISVLLSACAHAQSIGIFQGSTHQPVTLNQTMAEVQPGSIVVIGENHGFKEHQDQQLQIMQALRAKGLKVSVGLEFFTYTSQDLVDSYQQGVLAEEEFLKAIQWGSPSFDLYRDQALYPDLTEGSKTLALNAPRKLTSKVAKHGLQNLTAEEQALLPPKFSLGRESYKQRFLSMMPHLPSPEAGERYFAAQSIWDDTMAWRAVDYMMNHPDQVLVIVVGEFHVQFDGGLPDRIKARSAHIPVLSFSQINTLGLSSDEIAQEIAASPTEGPRAHYLWLAPAQGPVK